MNLRQAGIFLHSLAAILLMLACQERGGSEKRLTISLNDQWQFINRDVENGAAPDIDDGDWETVEVPHDWAINRDFNSSYDADINFGKKGITYTGRTGGLPHVGIGWYRKELTIPGSARGKKVFIQFDGAMSHARIYCNGELVGERPYGYISFGFELTPHIRYGEENLIAVRLENPPKVYNWYAGAGIYRHARLVITDPVHIPQWGTYLTTPDITGGMGTVEVQTSLVNGSPAAENIRLVTLIHDPGGELAARTESEYQVEAGDTSDVRQSAVISDPVLWSVDHPALYTARSMVMVDGETRDVYETRFGFRYFDFDSKRGFSLNGKPMKLKGVSMMSHDLGPLGVAVNKAAFKRQLRILKEMGANAIRTCHHPPAPELLDLCDDMGFLVIDETFEPWKRPKRRNDYNILFDRWAEKDLVSHIHRDRNHPSVILWSIGNEVPEQRSPGGEGAEIVSFLSGICHREDPSRPVTCAFNNFPGAYENGLVELLDVVGLNYKIELYQEFHEDNPHFKLVGSESLASVSSRGEYFFPVRLQGGNVKTRQDRYQCCSYDMERPGFGNMPDEEFAALESYDFIAGTFVWTGFDYLGEPTPYKEEWPARSSYFGIVDLAGIPKDRYYLFKSHWSDEPVLHLLPHWNWEDSGITHLPVFCYTGYDRAELFVNGKSLGTREKDPSQLYRRYRLVWEEVPYEPGQIRVVAYDDKGNPAMERVIYTAEEPHQLRLKSDREGIEADGRDMVFVTVSVVDKNGYFCPKASSEILIEVQGTARLVTIGSGDPTSLERYGTDHRKAFNGKCVAYIRSDGKRGTFRVTASSEGLVNGEIELKTD